ncbi:lipopolysaccharide biosynthesis protein [Asticcacaulis sp. W401b]|uniref:lipopolysaccharide biosynthesis protein n=1 Tax=Asticcacaulis sp. W401b TaxID=3388666 RepID=UPI003971174D
MFESLMGNKQQLLRIIRGFFAGSFDKISVTIYNIFSLSILPSAWGAENYGQWILLTTIPTAIILGDLGFGNVASNDMTQTYERGQINETKKTLQSSWLLVSLITLFISIIFISCKLLEIKNFGKEYIEFDGNITSIILAIYAIVGVQSIITNGIYRVSGRYAQGVFFTDSIASVERASILLLALNGYGFFTVSLIMLIIRIIGTFILYANIVRIESWAAVGVSQASWETIMRLRSPALASLKISASSAIYLQGLVVSIGHSFAPFAVSVFSPVRTICRLPLQISDLLGRSIVPEVARSYADKNIYQIRKIVNLSALFSLICTVPFCIILTLFGNSIINFMTSNKIHVHDNSIFFFVSVASVFSALTSSAGMALQAMNRHASYANATIFIYCLLALVPFFIWTNDFSGLKIVSVALAFADFILALLVWHRLRKELDAVMGRLVENSQIGGCPPE